MSRLRRFSGGLKNLTKYVARNDAGSAIVEMAISSLILFTTFFGVFEVTMACYTYNNVAEAARESARWAMVRGSMCSTYTSGLDHCNASSTDIQNHAQTIAAINWSQCTTSSPCVSASWLTGSTTTGTSQASTTWSTCSSGTCNAPGNMVVVVVSYPYALTFPMVKTFNLTLTSTSEMVVSQ